MKNMIAAFGLLVSVMAFAISDSEKEALLNRNMGPVADRVQMGSLIMGGSGSVYVRKAGDTMSGPLRETSTLSSVTHTANAVVVDGAVSAASALWVGQTGSGTGGRVRHRRDTGVEGWRVGLPGSTGGTDYVIRDVVNAIDVITVTTGRQVQLGTAGTRISMEQDGGNTSIQTVALSGVSTLISNTTITANSYPFPVTVGAANVAPWLIGVSAGVGYSIGATGAGSAKVVIFEGQ